MPSTPPDGTITRLVQSRGRPPPVRMFACAPSRALVEATKGFHVVCLSGPSLAPNSRTCSPSSRLTTVPRTHWVRYHVLPPLPRFSTTANGIKGRFELVCGSVHQADARLTLYSSPWGDFSDLHGPVVEGVTSKSTIGHLILIHLWPKVDKTDKTDKKKLLLRV